MTTRRLLRVGVAALILLFALSGLASAQHRARLSKDLSDQLAAPTQQTVNVIVEGAPADIQALAARHGAQVKRFLTSGGAVLTATPGQVDAISQDADVGHLSGDVLVYGSMDVTDAATGAALVWAGIGKIPGVTGKNITVAVVDSGIQANAAFGKRLIASFDFTTDKKPRLDGLGHGTHVAGIIGAAAHRARRQPDQPQGAHRGRVGDDERRHRGD
jgi:subtilisin family serine protease